MRRILDKLYLVSGWFGAGCIALIALLVVAQVLLNLVDRIAGLLTGSAIGLTIPSYADFTGFLLAAASFMALAYSLREGAHIRVSLVLSHLPSWMRKPVEIWCLVAALGISLYFCWYTAGLTWESYTYNDLSPGMIAVPIWIPQLPMLLGLFILSISLLDELVRVACGGMPTYAGFGDEGWGEQSENETLGKQSQAAGKTDRTSEKMSERMADSGSSAQGDDHA